MRPSDGPRTAPCRSKNLRPSKLAHHKEAGFPPPCRDSLARRNSTAAGRPASCLRAPLRSVLQKSLPQQCYTRQSHCARAVSTARSPWEPGQSQREAPLQAGRKSATAQGIFTVAMDATFMRERQEFLDRMDSGRVSSYCPWPVCRWKDGWAGRKVFDEISLTTTVCRNPSYIKNGEALPLVWML